jgi:hypothetical protein
MKFNSQHLRLRSFILKSIVALIATVSIAFPSHAHEDGPGVSSAKVMELSAHRIDRLVTLGKIDAGFLKKLEKMQVTITTTEAPIYYKVLISQTQPPQGEPQRLLINYDEDGKPLSYQVQSGGVDGPDYGWPDKDAGSLAENSLHYVLENNADAKISLFDKSAKDFTIKMIKDGADTLAAVQILSALTTEKLNIILKMDGTITNVTIQP